MLHYVALSSASFRADTLLASFAANSELGTAARALAQQCHGLLPGLQMTDRDAVVRLIDWLKAGGPGKNKRGA